MEKVYVSAEEIQTLLKEANSFVALFEGAIKHDFRSKNPTTRWSDIIELN